MPAVSAERPDGARLHVETYGDPEREPLVLLEGMGGDIPERVRSLVLAATHAGEAHAVPGRGRAPKDRPWLQLYAPGFADAHPEHVEEDLRIGRAQPQHPQGRRRQHEAIRAWDAYERLLRVRVPTLVLHGSEDQLIDVANARVLADRIPGAELAIVEGAGHVYHSERPEVADELVLAFIRRHTG